MYPKISIIIPIYKVEDYIEKCLISVIKQTYIGDIECLLIDDCSPDKSLDIAKKVISSYEGKITFIIKSHETNQGLSAARNTGIKYATGSYLYFLDSDDYIIPECIEQLVRMLMVYPEVEMVQGGLKYEFQNDIIQKRKCNNYDYEIRDDLPTYINNKEWIHENLLNNEIIPPSSWNKLFNKKFIINNGLFFKEGIYHEDMHYIFFLSKKLSSLALCKKNTYIYFQREGSIMHSKTIKRKESWVIILEDFSKNINNKYELLHIFKIIYQLYVFDDTNLPLKFFKNLSLYCNFINKMIISFIYYMPIFILKKRIICNNIINLFTKNIKEYENIKLSQKT